MILYLDTSSLFKLYHNEKGTEELDELFDEIDINEIILSEITKIEFASIVWKKIRTKELTKNQGEKLLNIFKTDFSYYTFVKIDEDLISMSLELINKYGNRGLRTLDSIQLATAYKSKDRIDICKSHDTVLNELLFKIGLKTE